MSSDVHCAAAKRTLVAKRSCSRTLTKRSRTRVCVFGRSRMCVAESVETSSQICTSIYNSAVAASRSQKQSEASIIKALIELEWVATVYEHHEHRAPCQLLQHSTLATLCTLALLATLLRNLPPSRQLNDAARNRCSRSNRLRKKHGNATREFGSGPNERLCASSTSMCDYVRLSASPR